MKLTSFNCTIELSKDENGYSNNYYIDVTDKGVSISHPYVTQSQEQVMFITKLIHDFIVASIAFNDRVDGFNRDNHLEQYAVVTPPQVETAGSDFDLDAKPAVAQPEREGTDSTDPYPPSMEDAKDDEEKLQAMLASGLKEETVIATVRGSSNEELTVIGE